MAEFLTNNDKRTCYCAEVNEAQIGQKICVMGWVQRQRDLGALIFIDLRDRTGIVQLAFDDKTDREVFDKAFGCRAEYVLCVHGTVRPRGEGAINNNIPTGKLEIYVEEMKVLSAAQTPPFEVSDTKKVKDETALKFRYVDLRRPELQKNIKMRHDIARVARQYYYENGFYEIETPMMIKATPEGARDYLVPSRIHKGSFYALPQSPQIYKQLLMLSGFDRYIQLARCFRDEDLRADRQPEFTQIDLEMSFATQEDIMQMNEGFIKRVMKETMGIDIETPMLRMTFAEAMEYVLGASSLSPAGVTDKLKAIAKAYANISDIHANLDSLITKNVVEKRTKEIDRLSSEIKNADLVKFLNNNNYMSAIDFSNDSP